MHFSCLHEHELHSVVCLCFCVFFPSQFLYSIGEALLKINQPLEFSETVRPICISTSFNNRNKTYDNEAAIISGWGNLDEEFAIGNVFFQEWHLFSIIFTTIYHCHLFHSTLKGNRPDVLQHAEVNVWSNRECQASYDRQNKDQTIWPTQMCAGRKIGGVDACWVSIWFLYACCIFQWTFNCKIRIRIIGHLNEF